MRGPYKRPVYEVHHFIREWRVYRGMTINMLAEKAKLTASMISQLERGKAQFKQGSFLRIAEALNVEPWRLLAHGPYERFEQTSSEHVDNNIRKRHKRDGISQEELARRVGTNRDQIDRLEVSYRKLTTDWVERIAKALGCDVDEIYHLKRPRSRV